MLRDLRVVIMQLGRQAAHLPRGPAHAAAAAGLPPVPFRAPARAFRPFVPLHTTLHPRGAALTTSARPASSGDGAADGEDVPFAEYSPEANSAYWSTRPVAVMKRLLEVGSSLGVWAAAGQLRRGAAPEARADSLRRILTRLGPTFIKIGQALSSRPDTLPPEFLAELEVLQDRLPPFPTDAALALIAAELGRPVDEIFSSISEAPVAAASLGQVYRAVLRRDGSEVAVKVQRPGVRASIALDVLVLRQLATAVRAVRRFNSDLPALLDEWATSLFLELNYRQEAANGERFGELYGHLEGVYVPKMVRDLTTQRVLVMEWVEGERLRTAYSAAAAEPGGGAGSADDIRLVEIGVRCSLEQLLEFGFYHADPHPGNLLRTRDGRLAYLDFGEILRQWRPGFLFFLYGYLFLYSPYIPNPLTALLNAPQA